MSVCTAILAIRRPALWLAFLASCAAAFGGTVHAQTVNIAETACDGIAMAWLPDPSNDLAPAVIFVPGRGPIDRFGNTPDLVYYTTLFVAVELQKAGIASVSFDKRGTGESTVGNGKAWDSGTMADEAEDVHCLVNWLREKHAPSRITLIGFDDGDVVAAMAAATTPVDAIVMLPVFETTARDMFEELRDSGLSEAATREIEQAVAARLKGEAPIYAHPILHRPVDTIVRRVTGMRPPLNRTDLVAHLNLPILLVRAARDFESSQTEIKRLAESAPHVTTVVIADTSSRLRISTAECSDTCQEERNPNGNPLQPNAVKAIVTFARCGSFAADPDTCRQATPQARQEPGH